MQKRTIDNSDQVVLDEKSDETYHGSSFNSLVTAGFAASIGSAIDTGKQEALWQNCLEKAPEISTIAVAFAAKQSAFKTLVTGISSIVMAVGVGSALIWYTTQYQPSSPVVMEVQQLVFIPEAVEINFVGSDPALPETYNPLLATIELSEGVAQEWCILDSTQSVVVQGIGAQIDSTAFAELPQGSYQIKWTVANEEGCLGYAYREFMIEIIE